MRILGKKDKEESDDLWDSLVFTISLVSGWTTFKSVMTLIYYNGIYFLRQLKKNLVVM